MRTTVILTTVALVLSAFAAPAPNVPGKHHKSTSCIPTSTSTVSPVSATTSPTSTSTVSPTAIPTATPTPEIFGGIAIRSGSDIQYASVNANGTHFYLNRGTSIYCPAVVGTACSNQTDTLFLLDNSNSNNNNNNNNNNNTNSNSSTLFLDVIVPGGQQVYVDATGALRFTVPHSADTGVGSSTVGFGVAEGGLHLVFLGDDFLACPVDDGVGDGAYEVYASAVVSGTNSSSIADCLGFAFRIADVGEGVAAAWEYI